MMNENCYNVTIFFVKFAFFLEICYNISVFKGEWQKHNLD